MRQYNFKSIYLILFLIFVFNACSTSGTYEGAYHNGKYHGQGIIKWNDGDRYEGSFQYGKYNGFGTYFWQSGGKIVGKWENNNPIYGTETYSGKWKGDKYIGNFKNWKKSGEGTYYFSNGNKYEGNWKKDKYDGLGVFTYKNGKVMEGFWQNGNFQYYAKINKNDKVRKVSNFALKAYTDNYVCLKATETKKGKKKWVFSGTTVIESQYVTEAKRRNLTCGVKETLATTAEKVISNKNIKNKTNSLRDYSPLNNKSNILSELPMCSDKTKFRHFCFGKKYTQKYKYTGEFKNNMKHGKGKYEWIANDKFKGYTYIGEYLNDKRHGYGKATWANGQKYTGQFFNGKPKGFGHYIYSNGDYYKGEIQNNKRNGEGIYFYTNGRKKEGIWKDGELQYSKKITNTNKLIAKKNIPKVDYDELYASRQDVERERKKRIDLERRLASLLAKQKEERNKIDTDKKVPILEIISNKTKGKQGTIIGLAKDNVKVAEVTVDGKKMHLSSNGNFKYSTYVPPSGVKLKIEVTDVAGLSISKEVELRGNLELTNPSISFDRLNPLIKRVKSNPNALALIIGISNYENTPRAIYADKDAEVFRDYATEKLGIAEDKIKVLLNNKADETEMYLSTTDWLRRSSKPNQSDIYIFFAGHGLASQNGKKMYLLPYDGSPRLLDKTAYLRDEMFADIKEAKPRSVTVFLDTCYSGTTRGADMLVLSRPIMIKAMEKSIPDNFTVFSAAASDQTSKPLEEAKHGMFSYFLMKGMEGNADTNNDKKITALELHDYIRQNVVQQSSGSQTPELQGDKFRVLIEFD